MSAPLETQRFGSGASVRRIEDPALVRGEGRYTDDVTLPGQTYLVFLRSDRAHARIAGIDTATALALPGVLAVYTGADLLSAGVKPIPVPPSFKRPGGLPMSTPPKLALAHEFVRFVGEPVVAIVAESRDAAKAAINAVVVEYEDLPAVSDAQRATAPGAPLVWPDAPGNIVAETRYGDAAATAAAFASAAHRVALDIVNQRAAPS